MPWTKKPGAKITATCPACGKEFEYYKCWPKKYCSQACYFAVINKPKITTPCPTCGKDVTYYASFPRKYCSKKCAGQSIVHNIPGFAPVPRTTYHCEQCGKEFEGYEGNGNRNRFCSLKCFGAWQRDTKWQAAENHPNWRGGKEPYYGPTWDAARKAARARDNYTCQDCGITEAELGKALDVHHLVRFGDFGRHRHEEANRLDNLVSLCYRCHTRREWHDNRGAG